MQTLIREFYVLFSLTLSGMPKVCLLNNENITIRLTRGHNYTHELIKTTVSLACVCKYVSLHMHIFPQTSVLGTILPLE